MLVAAMVNMATACKTTSTHVFDLEDFLSFLVLQVLWKNRVRRPTIDLAAGIA